MCLLQKIFAGSFGVCLLIELGIWERVEGSLWHFYANYIYFTVDWFVEI